MLIITIIFSFFKSIIDFFRYGESLLIEPNAENSENLETLEKIETLVSEIAMLENIIAKRNHMSYELELELENNLQAAKRHSITSKLITLDKQGFKDTQRLKKLKKELEELE